MSDNKKYYYLKLKSDFFEMKQIKEIEKHPMGDKYINILLKLYVISDYEDRTHLSIKTKHAKPIIEYISVMTGFDTDTIRNALKVYMGVGIITQSRDFIILRNLNINENRNRCTKKYKQWRLGVYERDNYTCVECGKRGLELNAHHIKQWAHYKGLRFSLENGITLCVDCHKKKHKRGKN